AGPDPAGPEHQVVHRHAGAGLVPPRRRRMGAPALRHRAGGAADSWSAAVGAGGTSSRATESLRRMRSMEHTPPPTAGPAVTYSRSLRPAAKLDRSASAVAARSLTGSEASSCPTEPCLI